MKIKNTLRTATVLALSIAALLVEQSHAQDLSLGLEVGLSMATFSVENIPGLDHKAGLAVGVSMAWRLDDLLSLQTGASWIRKGATGDIPGSITGFDETLLVDLRLDYLQLPALARFHFPTAGTLAPSLFAGPAVEFEVGCAVQTPPQEIALGCGMHDRTDWSVLLGGGLAYRGGGGGAVHLEGRYDIGLTEIYDISSLGVHNRGFVLTTGVSVPVGN